MEDTIIQVLAWIIVAAILAGIFYFIRGIWRAITAVLSWLWSLITDYTAPPVVVNYVPEYELQPMNKYLSLDQKFDEEKIKTLTSEFYVQKYLPDRNINDVRPLLDINLKGWRQSAGRDYVIALLVSRVNGKKKSIAYELELSRKTGASTNEIKNDTVCPHCGAPLQVDEAGKCEYCGSILKVGKLEWTVTNIKLL